MLEAFQKSAHVVDADPATKLAVLIDMSRVVFERLDDPEHRHPGHHFLTRFAASGCGEEVQISEPEEKLEKEGSGTEKKAKKNSEVLGLFDSFNPNLTPAFRNCIIYPVEGRTAACLFRTRLHEGTHAIAWSQAAVLHASPCNPAAVCIPSPADFAMIFERVEQDTYAKQGWINALLAKHDPHIYEMTRRDAVSAREFESCRNNPDVSLHDALTHVAFSAMHKAHKWGEDWEYTFADHYHHEALEIYENQVDYLIGEGKKPIFMRIESQDIADIGETFGPNIFKTNSAFCRRTHLHELNQERLNRLDRKYGTGDAVALPTFTQALGFFGLTRSMFLQDSKMAGRPQILSASTPSQSPVALPDFIIAAPPLPAIHVL